MILIALIGCSPQPPIEREGGQSGSLREELPLPDDLDQIDMQRAATEAVRAALQADLTSPWRAHVALLAESTGECPTLFLGAPEDANFDMDDDVLSWAGPCSDGGVDYDGAISWLTEVDGDASSATRSIGGDISIAGPDGVALVFDGEGDDAATWSGDGGFSYTSTVEGEVAGSRVFSSDMPLRGGWRGDSTITYDSDGNLFVQAKLFLFGEPLLDRFDAVVVDVEFLPECGEEPVGHVGLRGIDGYWFDVYFLPRYAIDDPSAIASAYPYELIDNPVCDGCGHLFVRNVPIEEAAPVCPDFAGLRSDLVAPVIDEYIMTLHELPWDAQ